MKILIVLNDAPYGSERTYNGLRLAGSLVKQADVELTVFLNGDAATAAVRDQKVPPGHYNVEVMLKGSAEAEPRSAPAARASTREV
jgi:uncharacterized protein involved in oxidation of intracellular sulfur